MSEVPDSVAQGRYRAMEDRLREPASKGSVPSTKSESSSRPSNETAVKATVSNKPNTLPAIPPQPEPTHNQVAAVEEVEKKDTEALANESCSDSDRAKLERKRRQQQKKEEFLQQMKRHKSDDSVPAPVPLKKESLSPVPLPEGV